MLFALVASFAGVSTTFEFMKNMKSLHWFGYSGASWIIAFSVQAIGEWVGLIRYFNATQNHSSRRKQSLKEYYQLLVDFDKRADDRQFQQEERFAVISEACGNGAIAIAVSGLSLALHSIYHSRGVGALWELIKAHADGVLISVVLTLFLWCMHVRNVCRRIEYMRTVVGKES